MYGNPCTKCLLCKVQHAADCSPTMHPARRLVSRRAHGSPGASACVRLPAAVPPMLSIPMRQACARLLAAVVLWALGPGAAHARPSDLELAAARAGQGVRALVKRLSGASYEGRDNDTPASDRAQQLLMKKLRRLGAGLDAAATGDDAYRQPFGQAAKAGRGGQVGTNLLALIRGRELPDEY